MTLSKVQKAERREERLKNRSLRFQLRANRALGDYVEAVRERKLAQREYYLERRAAGQLAVPVAEEDVDEFFG